MGLCVLAWTLVINLSLYSLVVTNRMHRGRIKGYLICAWGLPSIPAAMPLFWDMYGSRGYAPLCVLDLSNPAKTRPSRPAPVGRSKCCPYNCG